MNTVKFEELVKVSQKNDFDITAVLDNCVFVDREFHEDMTLRECRECTSQFVNELKNQDFRVIFDLDSRLESPVLQVSF